MEEQQPWVSCLLTDILISYLQESIPGKSGIDYPSLFQGIEGFEVPADPKGFLTDFNNWVPRTVLRELHSQCERTTGNKNIAYHAARAYFYPGKKEDLSPFEIIFRVLNDIRSVLISASLWAGVQTNFLKLQFFETQGSPPVPYLLAQFSEKARPRLGSIDFLRGLVEGFPRLYSFVEDVRCTEEISQVRIDDIVDEFPGYVVVRDGDRLSICHGASRQAIAEFMQIPLRCEAIPLSGEFPVDLPGGVVVPPVSRRITVLTNQEEKEPDKRAQAVWAYRAVGPGVLSGDGSSYSIEKDQVFNSPYSRFRLSWKERGIPDGEISVETVRREVTDLLLGHLRQIKRTQIRIVQHNIDKRRLTLENLQLRREVDRDYQYAGIVGHSPKMQQLFGLVRSIADTDVAVLIEGETGTGKELIARAIHNNGPRRGKRFVAVNCGALAETLLESELFGHEKGAFTGAIAQRRGVFEVADGGTLFLDEVGEVSPSTQIRLLRVLQEGEFHRVGGTHTVRVDVRVLSATNRNLEELVKQGTFRQDLYYRLNVFPLRVPPLRERREDIPLLVSHFLERSNRRLRKHASGVSPRAMAALMASHWPGNVRKLENVLQRMMIVAKDDLLDVDDLPGEFHRAEPSPGGEGPGLKGMARESAEAVERQAIVDALSQTGGNVTRAAKLLGISRATLQKRMKAYGLRRSPV